MAIRVITAGGRWRLGNGTYVNVWTNPWLKDIQNFKPTTPIIEGMEDLKVANLWLSDQHCWNLELVRANFNEQDVQAILKMDLPYRELTDKLIWNFTNIGNYTVKSGYHFAINLNQAGLATTLAEGWRTIWQLTVPPKVQSIVWWLCWDILPTRIKLHHLKVDLPITCMFCQGDIEHAWHLFIGVSMVIIQDYQYLSRKKGVSILCLLCDKTKLIGLLILESPIICLIHFIM